MITHRKKLPPLSLARPAQELLTAQEVCKRLRLPLSTVYHLAKTGALPAIQLGRTWRFPAENIAALTEGKSGPARILVVDDDAVTRTLVEEILGAQGYVVMEVGDAATGLAMALRHEFDLLLIDFKLPGKDGTELIRELRGKYSLSQMVMITAFAGLMEMDKLFGLGALTVLRKPFDADQLIECVERMLIPAAKKSGRVEKISQSAPFYPAINTSSNRLLKSMNHTTDVFKSDKSPANSSKKI